MNEKYVTSKKLIRPSIQMMVDDKLSIASILSAHGGLISIDERDLLEEYSALNEQGLIPTAERKE